MNISEKACINFIRTGKVLAFGGFAWGSVTGLSTIVLSDKDTIIANQINTIQEYKNYADQPGHDSIIVYAEPSVTTGLNTLTEMKVSTHDIIASEEQKLQLLKDTPDPNAFPRELLSDLALIFGGVVTAFGAIGTAIYRKDKQLSDHLGTTLHKKVNRQSPVV